MSEAIGQPGQAALPRPLGIGEILSTAFRLYQRHWRTLWAIAAVVVVPLATRAGSTPAERMVGVRWWPRL
jgi:hypothetical protein